MMSLVWSKLTEKSKRTKHYNKYTTNDLQTCNFTKTFFSHENEQNHILKHEKKVFKGHSREIILRVKMGDKSETNYFSCCCVNGKEKWTIPERSPQILVIVTIPSVVLLVPSCLMMFAQNTKMPVLNHHTVTWEGLWHSIISKGINLLEYSPHEIKNIYSDYNKQILKQR